MNNLALRQSTQVTAKPKFHGRKKLKSKIIPHYPANIEREYMRVTDSYMMILQKTIKKHLSKILNAISNMNMSNSVRSDSAQDDINYEFFQIASELEELSYGFDLDIKLTKLAEITKKMSVAQWKKICQRTLGINIFEDYYKGEFYRENIKQWVVSNVNLIKSTKEQSLLKMREIIQEGWQNGRLVKNIAADIQNEYNVGKRHARLIARDQIGKLNSDITRSQQADSGVSEYIWSTVQDERVRHRHAELNGKRFKWGEPPIVDERTGRRAEPGEDYQCRCVALPVFDIDELNLVFESTNDSKI